MDINTCLAPAAEFNLALFSHAIPALATMILGVFTLLRAQNRIQAAIFFTFTSAFTLWLILDLTNWNSSNYHLIAATWAPLDFINIVFFLLLGYFVYADLHPRGVPLWYGAAVLLAASIPFTITVMGQAVHEMYQAQCEMIGNEFLALYKLGVEILVLLSILGLALWRIASQKPARREIARIVLVVGSIVLFMGIFSGAERLSTITNVFEITLYSLFSLPVFILFLTIAITSYQTFRLGDYAVKALFYVFLVLAGTQFFFVQSLTDFLLAGMSFGVVLTLGIMLYRSTEREIKAKHELEIANQQQESLLHFISHEVKGYLTDSQAGFASIVEGDFGAVPDKVKGMATTALASVRRGVSTVMDILDASNLKKGTVSYAKKKFDFRTAIREVVKELKPAADAKHLTIDLKIGEGVFLFEGDEEKIRRHVLRNLIDNAIKYTPSGSVKVVLTDGKVIRFSVQDSGVGITTEDMQRLFTEGGKGKDSIKTNVDSTGYGLYIARQIVEAHGGKIWAESEGAGHGSRFIIEFPAM